MISGSQADLVVPARLLVGSGLALVVGSYLADAVRYLARNAHRARRP